MKEWVIVYTHVHMYNESEDSSLLGYDNVLEMFWSSLLHPAFPEQ